MITMQSIDKLREAAGIVLEDSFESGSKYQVGDRELVNLVKLAKQEAYKECQEHAQSLIKPNTSSDILDACNITCKAIIALIDIEVKYLGI